MCKRCTNIRETLINIHKKFVNMCKMCIEIQTCLLLYVDDILPLSGGC